MDKFAHYLAEKAVNLRAGRGRLMYETAMRYFSAIKNGIAHKLLYCTERKPLDDDRGIIRIRKGMQKLITVRAVTRQMSLSNSHESASDEDLKRIAILCLWEGAPKFFNFSFFTNTQVQFAGRARETAVLQFRRLTMFQPNEFRNTGQEMDKLVRVKLWRSKQVKEQDLSLFNHRDSFLLDNYFWMACSMVVTEAPSNMMFYHFISKKAAAALDKEGDDTNEEESDARQERVMQDEEANAGVFEEIETPILKKLGKSITITFNDMIRCLLDIADKHEEKSRELGSQFPESAKGSVSFNQKLSSHSQRHFAINTLNDSPCIKTAWVCFAAGWLMKAVRTIFDYLDCSC